jgi:hypothetical protein
MAKRVVPIGGEHIGRCIHCHLDFLGASKVEAETLITAHYQAAHANLMDLVSGVPGWVRPAHPDPSLIAPCGQPMQTSSLAPPGTHRRWPRFPFGRPQWRCFAPVSTINFLDGRQYHACLRVAAYHVEMPQGASTGIRGHERCGYVCDRHAAPFAEIGGRLARTE